MVLPEKLYLCLKWLCLVGIPALTVCYTGLANIWQFPYPTQIAETSAIICTLIGALIGVSTANYYNGIEKVEEEKKD